MTAYTSNLTASLSLASASDYGLNLSPNAYITAGTLPWDLTVNLTGAYALRYQLPSTYTSNTKIFNPGYNRLDFDYETGSNKVFVYFYDSTGTGTLVWKSAAAVVDGNWHTLVVNKTSTSVDIYHDGIFVATFATTLMCHDKTSTPFGLGGNNSNVYVDNLRMWNRNLTSNEALALPAIVPRSGLILEWLMNEGSGTKTLDTSGSNNTGTINNGGTYLTLNPIVTLTNRSFAASLSFAGAFARRTFYLLTATLSPVGVFTKGVTKSLTAINSFTGSIIKRDAKIFRSSLAYNNLIWNGSFENAPANNVPQTTFGWIDGTAAGAGGNITQNGWYCYNGGTSLSQALFDAANSHSGSYALKVSTTGAGTYVGVSNVQGIVAAGGVPVLPNTSYTFTGWMKTTLNSGSSPGAYIDLLEMDAAQGNTHDNTTTKINATTGWTQYSLTFTTQSTTRFIATELRIDGNQGAGTAVMDAWFDDLVLQPTNGIIAKQTSRNIVGLGSFVGGLSRQTTVIIISAALSFSGNFKKRLNRKMSATLSQTGSIGRRLSRSMTGILSYTGITSKRIAAPLTVAAVSYTGSQSRRNGKNFNANLSSIGGGNIRTNLITNPSFEVGTAGWAGGTNIVLSQSTSQSYVGSASGLMQNVSGLGGNNFVDANPVVSAGVTYTFSAYIMQTLVAGITTMTIKYYDSGNNLIATFSTNIFGNVSSWTRFSVTGTAPAGTATCQALFIGDSATGPYTMYFDAVMFEASSIPGSYFDGSTAQAQWTGTPNASTSVLSVFAPQVNKNLTALLSYTGTLVHLPIKSLKAILSYTGTFTRRIGRGFVTNVWLGNYTFGTGTMGNNNNEFGIPVVDSLLKQTNISVAANVSYTGSFMRYAGKKLTAVVSYTGTINRQMTRALSATLSPIGSFAKIMQRSFTAALSSIGSFSKQSGKRLGAAASFSGSIFRTIGYSMIASVSYTGRVLKAVARSLTTATLSYTGKISRFIGKGLHTSLKFKGTLWSFRRTHVRPTNPKIVNPDGLNKDITLNQDDKSRSIEL